MNKITRFQGKNSVFVKDKKHKILRRVEGQQAQNTRAGFFCCPLGLFMVTYRLRMPCSLQKCHSSCFFTLVFCFSSFWWLCFVFCFHVCLYCAFCKLDFVVSFSAFCCVTKKADQITEYLKCSFWCSALVPASSHFHLAQLRPLLGPEKHPSKSYLIHFYGS